jgi:hypothetical protein
MKKQSLQNDEEPVSIDVYEYIHTKAINYLELGPEKYRKGDAFRQPGEDLSINDLNTLQSGCKQILLNKGLTPETALEGLGIRGFYLLMQLLHFRVVKQMIKSIEADFILDKMEMIHMVTGQRINLFNKVEKNCEF